jgi:hypothetical protein
MSAGFGFSAGDFLASINLIYDVVKCLEDSTGSQAHYDGVQSTLTSLRTALAEAKTNPNQRDAVVDIVKACNATLTRFAKHIRKYDKSLGCGAAKKKSLKAQLRKVQWQLYSKEDVQKLQAEIEAHVSALNVVLSCEGQAAGSQQHKETCSILARIESNIQTSEGGQQSLAMTLSRLERAGRQADTRSELQLRFLVAIGTALQRIVAMLRSFMFQVFLLHGQLRILQRVIEGISAQPSNSSLAYITDPHGRSFGIDTRVIWTWRVSNLHLIRITCNI